ncbi:MAG: hypothetical protein ACRCX7_11375 [Cetobacterium sp.]|uniref:hypothetical protein n=1 Tax=Cetobacterium sp. TaxID=2071632 RepID=UPI003F368220
MAMNISAELFEIVKRFGMGVADLKTSPDYERELIYDVVSRELGTQYIDELVAIFNKKSVLRMSRVNGESMLKNVTSGEIMSVYTWSKVHTKAIYKAIRNSNGIFTYKGDVYELQV